MTLQSQNMKRYVASACLAGFHCKYNGKSSPFRPIMELYKKGQIIPICPELLGGLSIPREPSEQRDGKVYSRTGKNVTVEFERGANLALHAALASGARIAIVKARSPACGYKKIYDGSFTGTVCEGNGFWIKKLLEVGFKIFTEEKFPDWDL